MQTIVAVVEVDPGCVEEIPHVNIAPPDVQLAGAVLEIVKGATSKPFINRVAITLHCSPDVFSR